MKPLPILAAAFLLTTAAFAQTKGEAQAAENKSVVLATLKQEALKTATRLYLKPSRPIAEGLLCERRAVVDVPTNKRGLNGAYLTTPEPAKQSAAPVVLLNEKPRPAGTAFVLVTVYPVPRPAAMKRDTECYCLTPEAAALALYAAKIEAERLAAK